MDDELGFAPPPPSNRPPGWLERTYARIRSHRHARLLEFLFFVVPGALIMVIAWMLDHDGLLRDPLALLLGFVGVLTAGFGFLPPVPKPVEPVHNPKSRRRPPK